MAQTHMEFGTGTQFDWPIPGALSQTYSNVGLSGHDVIITVSGETGTLLSSPGTGLPSPGLDAFFSGDEEALSFMTSGLGIGIDTQRIEILLEFNPALPGEFGFDLFHLNKAGSGDQLDVTARTQYGALLNPTFSLPANPDYQVVGNSTLDAITVSTYEAGTAGVNFSSLDSIASVLISWSDCIGCVSSPHGMAFGNFEFCKNFVDQDEDGIEDRIDVDDDNDGIPDVTEACGVPFANPDQDTIGIEIRLDSFPQETSWELVDFRGNVLLSGGSYTFPADAERLIQEEIAIDADQQTVFRLKDSYGDALTHFLAGYYTLRRNGVVLSGPVSGNWGFLAAEVITPLGASYNKFAPIGSDYAGDDDGDGILNYADPNYCSLNAFGVCANLDTDSDGIIDAFDLDADNDGVVDNIEGQGSTCFTATGSGVDPFGMPLAYTDYLNCADNNTQTTYGIVPNQDNSNGNGTPDFLDQDTDGDGLPDYAEGFDFNGSGESFDDFIGFAIGFSGTNGSMATYPSGTDSDGDLIPDWLDNDPLNQGYINGLPPPFQTPGSSFHYDTDGDGIVDLLDVDNGGTWPGFPPDSDVDNDPDWRDLDNNTSLPVEFLSFNLRKCGEDAELQWNTAQEVALSHYEVFRSAEGTIFEKVGGLEAVGAVENHYTFVDLSMTRVLDLHAFYRLEAVNLDGSRTVSETRMVQWGDQPFQVEARVYPNPARDFINVQMIGPGEQVELTLYDALGRRLWGEEHAFNKLFTLQKDISILKAGVYLLTIETAGYRETLRVIHP